MTEAERDALKALTRKLGRIAMELTEAATSIQDIEGRQYKDSYEEASAGPADTVRLENIDTPVASQQGVRNDKIHSLQKQLGELEKTINDPKTPTHLKMKARNSQNVLKGHLTRVMNQVAELQAAGQVKEGTWKSQVR